MLLCLWGLVPRPYTPFAISFDALVKYHPVYSATDHPLKDRGTPNQTGRLHFHNLYIGCPTEVETALPGDLHQKGSALRPAKVH